MNQNNFKSIKSDILRCFQKKPNWYRKEIINECLKSFNFSEEQQNDSSSSSLLVQSKSLIGTVISSMINNNTLSIDNGKVITLGTKNIIILNKSLIEIYLKDLFKTKKAYTIEEIYNNAIIHFKTNITKTNDDDIELKRIVYSLLNQLLKINYIKINNNLYSLNKDTKYPNTEIGNCLNECYYNGNTFECFIKAINIKGGEFLEQYAVKLLEIYFIKGKHEIISSKVTGGSNDDGLDGIIETVDELGYYEKIFMQMKARNKVEVTVKEMREFYGALIALKGTRGIFVTNSNYHYLALDFIKKTNNLIGIDGKMLYNIAINCNYGIIKDNNKLILDKNIFL